MTLAIMQPYLFPYIGYWQLIHAVDTFVIYDDVTFIKQGYINRNKILSNNKAQAFTLSLKGASSNTLINSIEVGNNTNKLIKTIKQSYCKAPLFNKVFPLIEQLLTNEEKNLALFIGQSLQAISTYLEVDTRFLYSSQIEKDNTLTAQNKVIEICNKLKENQYINVIGGQPLYSKDEFKKNDISLHFIETELTVYPQVGTNFVPFLSIIDVMMFNEVKTIGQHLKRFQLV